MDLRRGMVCAGLAWAMISTAGCGGVPANGTADGADFVSKSVSVSAGRGEWLVDGEGVTSEAVVVDWPVDLPEGDDVTGEFAFGEEDLSVRTDGDDAGHALPGSTERHFQVTFRFAADGEDPCLSDVSAGPFHASVVGSRALLDRTIWPLGHQVRDMLRGGRLAICTETQADFRGAVGLDKLALRFGKQPADDEQVEICHVPPGNPDKRHTITIGAAALEKHLAHGDSVGPCEDSPEEQPPPDSDGDGVSDDSDACSGTASGDAVDASGCSCHQRDADADGVDDCTDSCSDSPAGVAVDAAGCACSQRDGDDDGVDDCTDSCGDSPAGMAVDAAGCACSQRDGDGDLVDDCTDSCPDTPAGDAVYANGCTVIVLAADAGPDRAAVDGDVVSMTGTGSVLQGNADPNTLVYQWTQVAGPAVTTDTSGASLTWDTSGSTGDFTFRLTVSTPDNLASASDDVNVAVAPAPIETVAAGRWHNAARFQNSRVALWGWDRNGQLGDGSAGSEVVSVDAGHTYTILSRADGTVWTFGTNALSDSATPTQVADIDDVVQVSALFRGGMMLRADGTVWGFGDAENRFCELAGSPNLGATGPVGPIPIPGLPGNIVSIATGTYHTVALGADGRAWVWGGSRFGCTPIAVLTDVVSVAAGETNLCLFVRGDGTAWGLGYNFYGQLGNGTTVSNYRTATRVLGLADVVGVAGGSLHSLFLRGDGTVWAAGWNHDCELGIGTASTAPVSIARQLNLTDVVSLAGGYSHSVAVRSDNSVWVWGANDVGQLSAGTSSTLPSMVCMPTGIALDGE